MDLKDTLRGDMLQAQKRGDHERVGVLRYLLSHVQNKEIEKRGAGVPLTDDDVVDVLRRESKKRNDAIALYTQGKRIDLADKESRELALIKGYLPASMDRAEVERVVEAIIKSGATDFGMVMRETMKQLKGKAEGALVSEVVKSLLR